MPHSFQQNGISSAPSTFGSSLPELAPAQARPKKTTAVYRKVGGHEILADVYRPKGNNVCPVVVYIHGGALIRGNRQLTTEYHVQARVLSLAEENGYALVSIDYRLAPETKLPAIVSDIEAAFAWLGGEGAKCFHLNTNRMVVVGDSAGGYLTLLAGYHVNPKPKALIALYGYGELNADWYTKPNPYPKYNMQKVTREDAMQQTDGSVISDVSFRKGDSGKIYMYYRQTGLWPQEVSGFSPESIGRDIAPYEPVQNVTREYPPTLMIHGTQDTDVPFEESLKMAEQFKRHGVPYILRPIDKGEHCFDGGDPAQIEDAYNTMREFMLRYLEAK
ncbi:alpha/beta hydrolase [Bradyrhizobium sp. B117]|uniref:alpha/beta hydrolase n=1 Tax=Bradyrhizobium sp. B117 TaxID=3140246 RepID=UPI003182ED77